MTKPFFLRLKNYYAKVGTVLRGEADSASIFPNPSDVGMSRERVYAEVLRLHLPSSCNVLYGGFLFGIDGSESKQLDLIITNDIGLQFNFHNRDGSGKSFACVDGTVAVVSVKSTLDSSQLVDSLENVASIPPKQPLKRVITQVIHGYDDWPYKIIYASKGISVQTALSTLSHFYEENPNIPFSHRPNLIHVAGKYVITRNANPSETRNGSVIPANSFHAVEETTDVFGLMQAVLHSQQIAFTSRYLIYSYGPMLDNIPFDL